MDEMRPRPRPQRRGVPAHVLGNLVDRQNGAIGDVPRRYGWALVEHPGAHRGPQSVGADQRAAGEGGAVLGPHRNAIAGFLETADRSRGLQADQVGLLARREKGAVEIGPVDHRVGVLEAFAEGVVERHPRDLVAAQAVHHDEVLDEDGGGTCLLGDAETLEHAENVGAELNAGPDLPKLGALFEHQRRDALARKRQGGGQTADTAADDEDGGWRVSVLRHPPPPPPATAWSAGASGSRCPSARHRDPGSAHRTDRPRRPWAGAPRSCAIPRDRCRGPCASN